MSYDYDRTAAANMLPDNIAGARIRHALEDAYNKGGFDAMMMKAYEVEAGKRPFDRIESPRRWLYDILNELSRKLPLTDKEQFRLNNYRQDVRALR